MQAGSVRPGHLRFWTVRCFLAALFAYLLLLIPDATPPSPKGAGQQAFVWNRDAFWSHLETAFNATRSLNSAERVRQFNQALELVDQSLDSVAATNLPPDAPAFDELETRFFQLAPIAA